MSYMSCGWLEYVYKQSNLYTIYRMCLPVQGQLQRPVLVAGMLHPAEGRLEQADAGAIITNGPPRPPQQRCGAEAAWAAGAGGAASVGGEGWAGAGRAGSCGGMLCAPAAPAIGSSGLDTSHFDALDYATSEALQEANKCMQEVHIPGGCTLNPTPRAGGCMCG